MGLQNGQRIDAAKGTSILIPTTQAGLHRGPAGSENAALDRKMPLLAAH